MNASVLSVQNLSFSYGETPVLSNISFQVEQGQFAVLTGPNGAGKSTLMKLLLGDLTPTTGQVSLLNRPMAEFSAWRRIGYIPQEGLSRQAAFPATVEEVVLSNLSGEIGLFRFPHREHRERVTAALKAVGMEPYRHRLIGALSGGQRQRVLLARALVSRPEVLLLDEPTSGMDQESGEAFYHLLSQLIQTDGVTILMVSHDLDRIYGYASLFFHLEGGALRALTPQQFWAEQLRRCQESPDMLGKGGAGHGNL